MDAKQMAIEALETGFRALGDKGAWLAQVLLEEDSDKEISLTDVPDMGGKIWATFLRNLVKVAPLKGPIFRTVTFRGAAGEHFRITLDVSDYTQIRYFFRFPDPPLRELIRSGSGVFVDIGANVGIFSLLASLNFSRVYAFEPLPPLHALLRRNIAPLPHVVASDVALSDREGEVELFQNAIGSGGSSLIPPSEEQKKASKKEGWNRFQVRAQKLDDALRDVPAIDLIKIDVEGHEVEVIRGGQQIIARTRPLVFVETHDDVRFEQLEGLLPEDYLVYDPVKRQICLSRPHPDTLFVPPEKMPWVRRAYGAGQRGETRWA